MLDYRNRGPRQGSAMLLMVFLVVFLAGTLLYIIDAGIDASHTGVLRENKDSSLAAAEFATELAVANLGDMDFITLADPSGSPPVEGAAVNMSVLRDWVRAKPYTGGGISISDSDQRRIAGSADDLNPVDYRVRVRSLRDARENHTMPSGWLSGIELGDFNYGVDPLRKFSNTYEITASARNHKFLTGEGKENPRFAGTSTLKSVVAMSYRHLLNEQEDMAVLNVDNPPFFASANWGAAGGDRFSDEVSWQATQATQAAGAYTFRADAPSTRLMVSGEDHYATRTIIEEARATVIVIDEIEEMQGTPSQMFSVINNPWNYGQLTLQYQRGDEPNPFIPRTNRFMNDAGVTGAGNIMHRQMIALKEEPETPGGSIPLKDKYVFGGKTSNGFTGGSTSHANYYRQLTASGSYLTYGFGRSVHLLEDGSDLIKETTVAEATPGAGMYDVRAFVIGSFDSLLQLYLNFTAPTTSTTTDTHPAITANQAAIDSWKSKWDQIPLCYWSAYSTKIGQTAAQIPLYNSSAGTTRHASTLFWVKNADGQFLVRDYKYGTSATPPAGGWTGYYTWAEYYGYTDSDTAGGGKYHKGWFTYSGTQNSTNAKNLHTRLFTLEELLGKRVTKGADGLPAKIKNGAVVEGVPDVVKDADGNPVPFEFTINGNVTNFDEATQRANTSANYGIGSELTSYNVPLDGIYVIERDRNGNIVTENGVRKVKICRTMADFAYTRDVSENPEVVDERTMVTLQMVIEVTPRTHTNNTNMWWDMGLSLTVVYPKVIEGGSFDTGIISAQDKAWWEGVREEGITDQLSHYAVMANVSDEIKEIDDIDDKLEKIHAALGLDPDDSQSIGNMFTAADADGNLVKIPRAIFEDDPYAPDFGRLKNPGAGISYGTASNVYFYGKDDILSLFSFIFSEQEIKDMVDEDGVLLVDPLTVALQRISEMNPGITLASIYDLYTPLFGEAQSPFRRIGLNDESPSAIKANGMYLTGRNIATEVFGSENQSVSAMYMVKQPDGSVRPATNRDLKGVAAANPNSLPEPKTVLANLDFIPTEILAPAPVQDGSTGEFSTIPNTLRDHLPILNRNVNAVQVDDRPIELKMYYDSDDSLSTSDPRYYGNAIRKSPDWYDDEGIREQVRGKYGSREADSRYGLGWHRNGPYSRDKLMRDFYEYVILGRRGFIPYERVLDGSAVEGPIALVSTDESYDPLDSTQVLEPGSDFKPRLKSPDKDYGSIDENMPTFVFEGQPIDGAGILVVNGNLVVRTEFAYHGTLAVLGNIYVNPSSVNMIVRNEDGMAEDSEGRVLKEDADGYYYTDYEGRRQTAIPKRENQWVGKLVVQGMVYAGGKISAWDGSTIDRPVPGIIDIRGSGQAVDETTGALLNGKEVKEMHRLNWTTGDSLNPDDDLWTTN